MVLVICFAILVNLCARTQADLFCAIADMECLLDTQKRIIDDIDLYIQKEEKSLSIIKRYRDLFKREQEKAMVDIPEYVGNPINAYTLIKRLTIDLNYLNDTISAGAELIKNVTSKHEDVKYPTQEDLTGAAQALARLQKMYRLDAKELAEGKLNGVAYSTPMTASDCYELGQTLYEESDYVISRAWMVEALRKYPEKNVIYLFTDADIVKSIINSCSMLGDTKNLTVWIQKFDAIEPKYSQPEDNVAFYVQRIAEIEAKFRKGRNTAPATEQRVEEPGEFGEIKSIYEALCRDDLDIPLEISSRLTCRYLTENHPFTKIAPFKIEMLYLEPDVVLFHDVLSDEETEVIKRMAKPRLKRAFVIDPDLRKATIAQSRISKLSWLPDKESDIVARITRRVEHMTGLNTKTAEPLQVANYGIGGFQEPHYDFGPADDDMKLPGGQRIATVIFYMSDVAQGGATVFFEFGLTVFPVKGSAIFWLNLHASGMGDLATHHAACPVLHGSKWGVKWLHQNGHEFLKPCNLEYQEEGFIRVIPDPIPKIRSDPKHRK